MANPQQLLNLSPYELKDVPPPTPAVMPPDPPDVVQLKLDIINVIEGRVLISSFTPEHQAKIKNFYRFHGQKSCSQDQFYPKMIRQTLDIV